MLFSELFNNWSQRRKEKYEANILGMKEQGKCPGCKGTGWGYHQMMAYEYFSPTDIECPECNGSGSFVDWATTHNRLDLL